LGGKSVWDWFSLLSSLSILAVVVTAAVGVWQTYQQHQSDQQRARDQHQSDQQLAQDQQRAAILQTYIDNTRDLLLTHNLAKSAPGDQVRQVARVQTLATLRSLDADRNGRVLRFLKEAHLIGTQNAIINLSNTDLRNDDLSGADLSGIDLNGAILTGTHLNDADLSGATLYGANLDNADLRYAKLSGAFMFDAILAGAHLNDANLNNAILTGAFLGGTIMNNAILTDARLNGAILAGAHLNGAYLSDADLIDADLTGTDLSGADLSDADLIDANLTQPQLDTVYSCTNTMRSTKLICQHNPKITLTYWYTENPAETPVILALICKFEHNHPNVHIDAKYRRFFRTPTEFVTASQEDKAPDVLRSDVGWVAQFASQDYLLNIDSYISQADRSDYLSIPLSYNYYNGYLYGLPQVTDFLTLLYNKAELAEAGITSPPATMTDFETDAKKIVQRRAARYGFETNGTGYNVLPFLYAFGGSMFDQHNNILVNSNGSVNGLKFLLTLQNNDRVMPANVNFSHGPGSPMVTDFKTGKAAMIFDGPYDVPEILTGSGFKGNPRDLGVARIPTGPAAQTDSPTGGQSYVISAGTAHPSEAYKFISFMSSTDSQVAIAKANNTLPTRKTAQNEVSGEGFISEFLPITPTAVARPAIPQGRHLFDAFDPNIAAVLDDVETPIAALNAVADAWKQLLASS
jgi:arabinogalactan oligomer/maltooligosaccharide transport system substrate-binding protein